MLRALLLLLLSFVFPCVLQAQGAGALAKMDQWLVQAAKSRSVISYKTSTPKSLTRNARFTKQFIQVEKAVQQSLRTNTRHKISFIGDPLPAKQKEITKNYHNAINYFKTLKQEADPFLYYQAKPIERRSLAPQEVRQWLTRIYTAKRYLDGLRGQVSSTQKEITQAYMYLDQLLKTVSPSAAEFIIPKKKFPRPDRTYQKNEFFLHDPATVKTRIIRGWNDRFPTYQYTQAPAQLKIAIFNDAYIFKHFFEQWHKDNLLWPDHQVRVYSTAEQLLQNILRGEEVPDVIITDLLAENNLGGIELTQELRNSQYNGIIIGLSAFEEEELKGENFMQWGFDGMISNPTNRPIDPLRRRMNRALENYFYYRDLHGWKR